MPTKPPYENAAAAEADHIDVDTTAPYSTEFELPLPSDPPQRESDKLFYKGRLLPLIQNPVNDNYVADSKKSWSKKLKWMRKSNLGLKLKASQAYIKSLFIKSDESKVGSCTSGYLKAPKSTLLRSIADEELVHRKSFSGAINYCHRTSLVLSSCSSSSSFSIVNSEAENPIEGAIAHCKKSQQPARKSM